MIDEIILSSLIITIKRELQILINYFLVNMYIVHMSQLLIVANNKCEGDWVCECVYIYIYIYMNSVHFIGKNHLFSMPACKLHLNAAYRLCLLDNIAKGKS